VVAGLNVATIASCTFRLIIGSAGESRVIYAEVAKGALRINGGPTDDGTWHPDDFQQLGAPPGPGFWCTGPEYEWYEELDLGVLPSRYFGGFAVPLWLPSLLSLVMASYLVGARRAKAPSPALCGECGYDLRGLAASAPVTCPECGRLAVV
jgi:hypothetical protein